MPTTALLRAASTALRRAWSSRAARRREKQLRAARAKAALASTRERQPYQNHGPGGH